MSTLHDRRKLPIFIHSQIDDMTDLTPNAMRVYMHLARRADKDGVAWPSYQSIGDHCFSSISDNPKTRRSFARRAIDELIAAGLIEKTNRFNENGKTSNAYTLIDPMPIGTAMPIDTAYAYKHNPMPIGTKDTPDEGTPSKESSQPAAEDDGTMAKALVAELRNRQFMYLDRDSIRLADNLLDKYGWEQCVDALDRTASAHLAKIQKGERGIMSPLAYMRSLLDQNGIPKQPERPKEVRYIKDPVTGELKEVLV